MTGLQIAPVTQEAFESLLARYEEATRRIDAVKTLCLATENAHRMITRKEILRTLCGEDV